MHNTINLFITVVPFISRRSKIRSLQQNYILYSYLLNLSVEYRLPFTHSNLYSVSQPAIVTRCLFIRHGYNKVSEEMHIYLYTYTV